MNYAFDQDSVAIFSGLEIGKVYSFIAMPGHLVTTRSTTGQELLSPILIVADGFGTGTPGIANALRRQRQDRGDDGGDLNCLGETTFFAFSQRNHVTGDGTMPMLSYYHRPRPLGDDNSVCPAGGEVVLSGVITVTVSGEEEADRGDWRLIVLERDASEILDVGQDADGAAKLTVGQQMQSEVNFIGDRDWFTFDAQGGKTYRIDVRDVLGGDAQLRLRNAEDACQLAEADVNGLDLGETLIWQAPGDATVAIEVRAFADAFQFRYVVGVDEDTP